MNSERSQRPRLAGGLRIFHRSILDIVVQDVMGVNPDLKHRELNNDIVENRLDSIGMFNEGEIKPPSILTRAESDSSEDMRRPKRAKYSSIDTDDSI
jgi:hypothetical protein